MTSNEEFQRSSGTELIDMLGLRLRKGRVSTTWGTKRPLGLYRSVQSAIEKLVKKRDDAFTVQPRCYTKVIINIEGNSINSNLKKFVTKKEASIMETMLLAMHCAGIYLTTPSMSEALDTTLDALGNSH
jgi:hypothetical protein